MKTVVMVVGDEQRSSNVVAAGCVMHASGMSMRERQSVWMMVGLRCDRGRCDRHDVMIR